MSRTCSLPAEDQLAILDLISRYNYAADEGNSDEVVACYTEDGFLNGRTGHYVGHDNLRKIGLIANGEYQPRHIVSNSLIRARGETKDVADVKSHLLFYEVTSAGITFEASGIYTDVVVKIDGEWKFRSRVMTPAIGRTWPGQKL